MVLVIISLCVLAAYIAATCFVCKGVPYSVSDTFYHLKNGWWFTAALWVVAFLLLIGWIDVGNPDYQCFTFLSCAGMLYLAAAPNFKCGPDRNVHIGGTIVCALSAMTWVALHVPLLLLLWLPLVIYIIIEMRKGISFRACKPLFWAEITAFVVTYAAIFIAR